MGKKKRVPCAPADKMMRPDKDKRGGFRGDQKAEKPQREAEKEKKDGRKPDDE